MPKTKLKKADITAILGLLDLGLDFQTIGKGFNVSKSYICRLNSGERRRRLTGERALKIRRNSR